jgi:Uma2 family endonuclease
MTVATTPSLPPAAPTPPTFPEPALDGIVLDGVSWETYKRLRDELDDIGGQHVYITYDEGRMVLMSPRPEHERWKKFIARLVEMVTLELNVPIASLGSTTWRRRKLKKGLEPDECYYVQSEPRIRGKLDIDLRRDPPPDLAIEVEFTNHPADRHGIYAALGVPEIWRYDGQHLTCLLLAPDRTYRPSEKSLALPFLRPADLQPFVAMLTTTDENSILRSFRDWVRQNLRVS